MNCFQLLSSHRALFRASVLLTLAACTITPGLAVPPAALPPATAAKLPAWCGFNLTEKFNVGANKPFQEEDFRMIAELGFNFVRLPMDYRIWIRNGDWNQIDEAAFPDIDRAVEYGAKYGIHVCLNFHRAPGYTVAKPAETHSLWTDPEAQRVCAKHWGFFARHYRGISNERLSFNLLNEPADISPEVYRTVVTQLVNAIREEDPKRLIIADGIRWGGTPCRELADIGIAQATRGYEPMALTHFGANWVSIARKSPPTWPMPNLSSVVRCAWKENAAMAMTVSGTFPPPAQFNFAVSRVQPNSDLMLAADGKPIFRQVLSGTSEHKAHYQFSAEIPEGTRKLVLSASSGWAIVPEIGITTGTPARRTSFSAREEWGVINAPLQFDPSDSAAPFKSSDSIDRGWLQTKRVEPWKELQKSGVGVFVGEFGFFNKTPHAVGLAWMEDCLKNWHDAGWGWALWNFRGSFGILDSGRADVNYENFHGHKLDRAMLSLLLRYR